MTPLLLAILLFAIGFVFLGAELFIPAHGATAGMGILALVAGAIACFFVGPWVGVGVLGASATLGPLAAVGLMRIFPYTWMARRLFLAPAPKPDPLTAASLPSPVRVGQVGVTVSALRPYGVCEFKNLRDPDSDEPGTGPIRVPTISDFGDVAPGRRVRVICYADGRAIVRKV